MKSVLDVKKRGIPCLLMHGRCLMKCGALQTNAKKRDAALEEVRAAVEELVLAGGHAAELAPRSPDVMQAQASSQVSSASN